MSAARQRVDDEPAFVLHAYPFRETSLVVEIFSRNHGRLGLVARGAKRPKSALRGTLLAFQPLSLGWFGRGEVRTLAKAEWQGGQPLLRGQALLCGYYLNELLLRLLPREDAHPALFDVYRLTLERLAADSPQSADLRRFELALMRELGYGLTLDRNAENGERVDADKMYFFQIERGAVPAAGAAQPGGAPMFSGRTLLAMAADDFSSPVTQQQSKTLMRLLINHYLSGQNLNSRRIFMELQEL
jgi:DNA repair protein RecO (recombination protein O)